MLSAARVADRHAVSRIVGALLAGLCLACSACDDAPRSLTVDVQTDLVPGAELGALSVELFEGSLPRGSGATRARTVLVTPSSDEATSYQRGRRVAELAGLPRGTYTVRVVGRRLAPPGEPLDAGLLLVERRVVVLLDGDRVVRVVLGARCVGVTCPGPGEDDARTQCLNGACVDPRCDPSDPREAGLCCTGPGCGRTALCATDADCLAPACAEARCLEGACVAVDREGACGDAEYCDRSAAACLPLPGAPIADAGPPDAAPPLDDAGLDAAPGPLDAGCPAEVCGNGGDDDCDGLADCRDPDCVGVACDDADPCTHGDACTGAATGAACAGAPIVCASTECMTRACNGTATCTETPRTGGCTDDGNACTGDVCAGGVCTHPRHPDGRACGTGGRCCAGACRNVASDPAHCGVCGVVCPGACRAGACACASNVQCIDAGYGPDATCFDPGDGNGMRCQCVCVPGDASWRGVCEDCPGAARCDQRAGLNLCGYF
jgi:hypothetical protein